MSRAQTAQNTKAGTSNNSKKAKSKPKPVSQDELADLDLDPVEDKDLIEALKSGEQDVKSVKKDDKKVSSDKSKPPKAKKAEVIEPKRDLKELEKVAKTENELMDMIALAKINKVKQVEVSKDMMLHYNRGVSEVPNYMWFNSIMLILEGKKDAVNKDLSRSTY